jgi:Chaperone of endosialidase
MSLVRRFGKGVGGGVTSSLLETAYVIFSMKKGFGMKTKKGEYVLGVSAACALAAITVSRGAFATTCSGSSPGAGNGCLEVDVSGSTVANYGFKVIGGSSTSAYGIFASSTGTGPVPIKGSAQKTAIIGECTNTSTGYGVQGSSASQNNAGAGVYGYGSSSNLSVGVKGQAEVGGTGVWGLNVGGQAAWFDGKTTVSGDFQVQNGTPFCAGCTAFTNNSDLRLKKNVKPLEGALERVLRLRGVTFEWKEPAEHGNHQGLQRGFIAQDVEQVIPEWVGVDEKGFKTLNLTGLEPMLVESLRTLKAENNALRADNSKLDERVKALEAKTSMSRADMGGASTVVGLLALAAALAVSRRNRPARS